MPRVRTPEQLAEISKIVKEYFYYSEEKRDLCWAIDSPTPKRLITQAGDKVGAVYSYKNAKRVYKYRTVTVKNQCIMVDRAVIFLKTGLWPTGNIIHRDTNPDNCSFENLIEIAPRIMNYYMRLVNASSERYLLKNKSITKRIVRLRKKPRHEYCVKFGGQTLRTAKKAEAYKFIIESARAKVQHLDSTIFNGIDMSPYTNMKYTDNAK